MSGVPEELRDLFSSRRKEILAALEKMGHEGDTSRARETANLTTRRRKTEVPRDVLMALWKELGEKHDFHVGDLPRLAPHERFFGMLATETIAPTVDRDLVAHTLVSEAYRELTDAQNRNTFTRRDLLLETTRAAYTRGASFDDVEQAGA